MQARPRGESRLSRVAALLLFSSVASCRGPEPTPAPPGPLQFPSGFQWGVSTAAEESQGDNTNSDWATFGQLGEAPPAGLAQNGYALYATDVANTAALHLNSYQFTIEWARIVPNAPADPTAPLTAADVDPAAVAHYHSVVNAMLASGITPVVTVTHFSLPQWVDDPAGYDSSTNTFSSTSLGGWST